MCPENLKVVLSLPNLFMRWFQECNFKIAKNKEKIEISILKF